MSQVIFKGNNLAIRSIAAYKIMQVAQIAFSYNGARQPITHLPLEKQTRHVCTRSFQGFRGGRNFRVY